MALIRQVYLNFRVIPELEETVTQGGGALNKEEELTRGGGAYTRRRS